MIRIASRSLRGVARQACACSSTPAIASSCMRAGPPTSALSGCSPAMVEWYGERQPPDVDPTPARSQRALTRLLGERTSPEAVDQLLREHQIPLVDGPTSTFLWRGEADWVGVEHRMPDVPIPLPLRRLKGTDLWYASVELPRGARVQYRLLVRRGEHTESMNDPLNKRVVGEPIGSQSVLEADGYVVPDWTRPDPA